MNTICTDRDGLEKFMRDNLKESRYIHSLGVERMASELAGIWGADVDKAGFAGRYHDIAKCFPQERMDACIREYGLPEMYLGNNALAHSKVAAEILKRKFGVTDEDVLDAVRSHTTGRDGMSLLEEVVYVADAIEDGRNYEGLKELQELARKDLDAACLFIMDYTIDRIKSLGRVLDDDTARAREYIYNKINHNKS